MTMLDSYLMIGEVLKPQGISGELKVRPITYDVARFEGLAKAYIKRGNEYAPVALRVNRINRNAIYLTIEGVNDRDGAERLRGAPIYVGREDSVKLPEDAEFICDLIGVVAADDEGRLIGEMVDVMQPGAGDVYVFRGPLGEVLVPALKSVVLAVDVVKKTMLLSAKRMNEVAVFED